MQRTFRNLFLLPALTTLLGGCSSTSPSESPFIIRVNAIEAPATVEAGDPFHVRFTGAIGPNGCWSLERVERTVTASRLAITFYGLHTPDDMCTQSPVALDYQDTLRVAAAGTFRIIAQQPSGDPIADTVSVE